MGRPRTFDEDAAVDAAVELFRAQGYRATTPAELGDALGMGRGSLYHAFGSKHELYRRALDRYVEGQRQAFLGVLEGDGPADERLRAALGLVLDGSPDPSGCLVTTSAIEAPPGDGATAEAVRRVLARQQEVLTLAIEDGRRLGELPAGPDAARVAEAMVALLNGVRVLQRAGAPPGPLVDLAMRLL